MTRSLSHRRDLACRLKPPHIGDILFLGYLPLDIREDAVTRDTPNDDLPDKVNYMLRLPTVILSDGVVGLAFDPMAPSDEKR